MTQITDLWRHPVKGIGREQVAEAELKPGETFPYDRIWALAHEAANLDRGGAWAKCSNFLRGAKAPELQAVTAAFDPSTGILTLRHPRQGDVVGDPDKAEDASKIIDWVRPLVPETRAAPSMMVRGASRGFTDHDAPTISIMNHASLRALSQSAGKEMSQHRFRGNIWVNEDWAPWEELGLVGKTLQIGSAEVEVIDPVDRCELTAANPETGQRDFDTLGLMDAALGHRDFGIHVVVTKPGHVKPGDTVAVL